ncbi:MAG: hypothetical protein P8R37_10975 [Opitutae bacterium]|nr:hypothetical protein [Opitutae bacterium]
MPSKCKVIEPGRGCEFGRDSSNTWLCLLQTGLVGKVREAYSVS